MCQFAGTPAGSRARGKRRLPERGTKKMGYLKYHGSLSMLVSAMTREETLPQEEIDELYALLNEMEAKNRRD